MDPALLGEGRALAVPAAPARGPALPESSTGSTGLPRSCDVILRPGAEAKQRRRPPPSSPRLQPAGVLLQETADPTPGLKGCFRLRFSASALLTLWARRSRDQDGGRAHSGRDAVLRSWPRCMINQVSQTLQCPPGRQQHQPPTPTQYECPRRKPLPPGHSPAVHQGGCKPFSAPYSVGWSESPMQAACTRESCPHMQEFAWPGLLGARVRAGVRG